MRLTVNGKFMALSGHLREMVERGEKVRRQAGSTVFFFEVLLADYIPKWYIATTYWVG